MLCVRCLAMGFHPSKARLDGPVLLAQLSGPGCPFHQMVGYDPSVTRTRPRLLASPDLSATSAAEGLSHSLQALSEIGFPQVSITRASLPNRRRAARQVLVWGWCRLSSAACRPQDKSRTHRRGGT